MQTMDEQAHDFIHLLYIRPCHGWRLSVTNLPELVERNTVPWNLERSDLEGRANSHWIVPNCGEHMGKFITT